MELGDHTTDGRDQPSVLDVALDAFDSALNSLIETVEGSGLDQLNAAEKVAAWQRFETSRNRLPLIDHSLIADAQVSDLPGTYCFSTMTRFLVRMFQLSPGEAAARVRAAAALGPRRSMLGEKLQPLLPQLAALQRDGAVSTEKVSDCGTRHAPPVPTRLEPGGCADRRAAAHRARTHPGADRLAPVCFTGGCCG